MACFSVAALHRTGKRRYHFITGQKARHLLLGEPIKGRVMAVIERSLEREHRFPRQTVAPKRETVMRIATNGLVPQRLGPLPWRQQGRPVFHLQQSAGESEPATGAHREEQWQRSRSQSAATESAMGRKRTLPPSVRFGWKA